MEQKTLRPLLDLLNSRHAKIVEIERGAKECVERSDAEEYKNLMLKKAEILADLTDDALPLLQEIPELLKNKIKTTLNSFSINASEALELESTFYMSALLFPEDYEEGIPDNLEKFIKEIEAFH